MNEVCRVVGTLLKIVNWILDAHNDIIISGSARYVVFNIPDSIILVLVNLSDSQVLVV